MRKLIMIAMLLGSPAAAHDYWSDGRKVDPITKQLCCSGADTTQIPLKMLKMEMVGVRLLDTGELIPFERIQPSPDDNIWVSRWGGSTKCFFYPSNF